MQKLVTISFSGWHKHGEVQEHLTELLGNGWRIISVNPASCSVGGESNGVAGWIAVVLEKP
jgi:hypothetical protein